MCFTRLAENTGCKKSPKIRHLRTITQLCRAIFSQIRHVSTVGKKLVKQQNLPHMSSQYGEHRPTNSWDRFISLGTPANSTGFTSWLQYCTNVAERRSTKLCMTFCHLIYIYVFGGSCPLTEFRQVQNSLRTSVAFSGIWSITVLSQLALAKPCGIQ